MPLVACFLCLSIILAIHFFLILLNCKKPTPVRATGWEDIELYAEGHAQWLETFLALPWGIPHADCYRRVFARIEPDALHRCFRRWVTEIVKDSGGQVIAIDGKTMRGSYDRATNLFSTHKSYLKRK